MIEQMKNFYRTRLLSCIVPGELYICPDGRTGRGEESSMEWKGDEAVCRELELSVLSQNQAGIRQKLQQLFGLWQEKKVSVAWLRKRIHWFTAVCEKAGVLKEDRISLNDWIDEEVLGMDSYAEVQEFLIQLLDKSFQLDKAAMEKGDEVLFYPDSGFGSEKSGKQLFPAGNLQSVPCKPALCEKGIHPLYGKNL